MLWLGPIIYCAYQAGGGLGKHVACLCKNKEGYISFNYAAFETCFGWETRRQRCCGFQLKHISNLDVGLHRILKKVDWQGLIGPYI